MTPYKELLADVRRTFREIRKEYAKVKKEKRGAKLIKEKYELEARKLQRMTGGKYKFSLANLPKTTENLEKVLEELETFLNQPSIRKSDREKRREEQLKKLGHEWELTENESWKFYDLINSSEVRGLMEMAELPSELILELATNKTKAKKAIRNIANMSMDEIDQLKNMSRSEQVDYLNEIISRGTRFHKKYE